MMRFHDRTTRKAHYILFTGALLASMACGEAEDQVIEECWPIDSAVAGEGSIQLGPGLGEFSPFVNDQELYMEAGGQGGHHFRVITRIEGLEPGDPEDSLSKRNPRTRLNLIGEDGESITNVPCPTRIPYIDKGEGFELRRAYSVVFPLDPELLETFENQSITIRAEIIDADGNFAVSESRVTAKLPVVAPPSIGASIVETSEAMSPLLP
ncbi:MAG: hypothetical protein GY811_17050 [Myxococcales bacterium]|nr:hypothetical protein [Myxococcales bacterium]